MGSRSSKSKQEVVFDLDHTLLCVMSAVDPKIRVVRVPDWSGIDMSKTRTELPPEIQGLSSQYLPQVKDFDRATFSL